MYRPGECGETWGPGVFPRGELNILWGITPRIVLYLKWCSSIFDFDSASQSLLWLTFAPDMVSDEEVTPAHNHYGTEKKENDDSISKDPISGTHNEYDIDGEEKQVIGEQRQLPDLQRRLRSRHLQMIAIGNKHAAKYHTQLLTYM